MNIQYGIKSKKESIFISLLLALVVLALWGSTTPIYAQIYDVYIGEYPDESDVEWAENTQGITHDDAHWYITQTKTLWKIPVNKNLEDVRRSHADVKSIELDEIKTLKDNYYNHFGDLTYFEYKRNGYLLVPIEGGIPSIAVFDAKTLKYIDHAPLGGYAGAPWCAVDPSGFVYLSTTGIQFAKITVNWEKLRQDKKLEFTEFDFHTFFDEQGKVVVIHTPQGGVVTENGKYLYLVAGYYDWPSEKGAYHPQGPTQRPKSWGINIFDLKTGKRIKQSQNGKGPFNYEFYPLPTSEEPEGITIWDLEHSGPREIRGQLHVLLLDNDGTNHDDVNLKHYTTQSAYPVLYENENYGGRPVPLRNNISSLSSIGFNDQVSSVWVPTGQAIALYNEDNYRGASIRPDKPQSKLYYNDKVSSVRINVPPVVKPTTNPRPTLYVTLYEHANYKGKHITLSTSSSSLAPLKFNDKVSSIKIPKGLKVYLYQHDKYKGKEKLLTSDQKDLHTISWGDSASSIKVYPSN